MTDKIVKEAEAWLKKHEGPSFVPYEEIKLVRSLLATIKELRRELALDGEPYTDREKHLARISELEQQLAEAAQEINCAGTVAHRIRILKKEHSEQFSAKNAEIAELKAALEKALRDTEDGLHQSPCDDPDCWVEQARAVLDTVKTA